MSYDIHFQSSAAVTAEPAVAQDDGSRAGRGERIIAVVVTSLAVLIVAVIAVLMGMA